MALLFSNKTVAKTRPEERIHKTCIISTKGKMILKERRLKKKTFSGSFFCAESMPIRSLFRRVESIDRRWALAMSGVNRKDLTALPDRAGTCARPKKQNDNWHSAKVK